MIYNPFFITSARYKEYDYDIQNAKAIIPEWETEIKEEAFWCCEELTSVELPQWIKKINYGAFGGGCENLTSITLPEWVEEIGASAFDSCKNLKSITLPRWVKKIGDDAFSGCSSLTSISVSKDNKVYDSREDCNAIIHTESNTLISGCKNTTIPPSVTEIGGWAFFGCKSLTNITIPPSVTEIGKYAFKDCSSLTSITIPPSVTKIGDWDFSYCSNLTEVRIPKGCHVDNDAFKYCPHVEIIRY